LKYRSLRKGICATRIWGIRNAYTLLLGNIQWEDLKKNGRRMALARSMSKERFWYK